MANVKDKEKMSNKTRTLQEEIEVRETNVSAAIETLKLVKAVQKAVTPELDRYFEGMFPNGYCSDATLFFKGRENLASLMKAFPPAPCVLAFLGETTTGNKPEQLFTVKPKSHLRPTEQQGPNVFPVFLDFANRDPVGFAVWWTQFEDKTVTVRLSGFSKNPDTYPVQEITNKTGTPNFSVTYGKLGQSIHFKENE